VNIVLNSIYFLKLRKHFRLSKKKKKIFYFALNFNAKLSIGKIHTTKIHTHSPS